MLFLGAAWNGVWELAVREALHCLEDVSSFELLILYSSCHMRVSIVVVVVGVVGGRMSA